MSSDVLSLEASEVVESLKLTAFLDKHRHQIRGALFKSYQKRASDRVGFLLELYQYADFVIGLGSSSYEDVEGTIEKILPRCSGDLSFANTRMYRLVMLYILGRALEECQSDLQDWNEMQDIVRGSLFDLNLLEKEASRYSKDVLGIEDVINDRISALRASIEQEYRSFASSASEEELSRAFGRVVNSATMVVFESPTQGHINVALDELSCRVATRVLAQHLCTLYVLYFILIKCTEGQECITAYEHFKQRTRAEIQKLCR